MYMTDWEHKERNWSTYSFQRNDGAWVKNQLENKYNFTNWLDLQCTDGWEVIKISRNFIDDTSNTWCVFRRKK